jgi:hypothetical protein
MYKPFIFFVLNEDTIEAPKGTIFHILYQGEKMSFRKTVYENGQISEAYVSIDHPRIPLENRKQFFTEIPAKRAVYIQQFDSLFSAKGSEWYIYPQFDADLIFMLDPRTERSMISAMKISDNKNQIYKWLKFDHEEDIPINDDGTVLDIDHEALVSQQKEQEIKNTQEYVLSEKKKFFDKTSHMLIEKCNDEGVISSIDAISVLKEAIDYKEADNLPVEEAEKSKE